MKGKELTYCDVNPCKPLDPIGGYVTMGIMGVLIATFIYRSITKKN